MEIDPGKSLIKISENLAVYLMEGFYLNPKDNKTFLDNAWSAGVILSEEESVELLKRIEDNTVEVIEHWISEKFTRGGN